MLDASEEPFRPRAIARRSCRLRNGYQVFRAGKQKRIAIISVPWDPSGSLTADAWDAQAPAQAEGAVPIAGAVDEIELWLEPIAPRRERNGHREVPCAGVEIGRECLADTVKGTSPFGQRDHLAGNAGFVTHCSFPRMTVSTMPAFNSLLTFTVCYGLCQAGSLLEDVLLFVGCVAYRGGCRAAVICRPREPPRRRAAGVLPHVQREGSLDVSSSFFRGRFFTSTGNLLSACAKISARLHSDLCRLSCGPCTALCASRSLRLRCWHEELGGHLAASCCRSANGY